MIPFSSFSRLFRLLVILLVLVAQMAITADAWAARKRGNRAAQTNAPDKYAAIVIDAATGEVLMAANADSARHPASLTKMMTMLLAFDTLAEKRIKGTDYIRISNHAASMSPSKLGIKPGGRITVDQALRAISVKSANDIAAAIAEALGGSEARFAQKMTARAREIGMTRTHFVNASGLHSPFQVTSARDMAILARYIINTYPRYYRYFGLRQFSYAGRVHPNHNKLMNTYAGMDGMKTGYISQSGFNLVASATRGDRRLIGVVLGGRSAQSRNEHMEKILDAAFLKPPKLQKTPDPVIARQDLPVALSPTLRALGAQEPAGLVLDSPTLPSSLVLNTESKIVNGTALPGRKPILAPAAGVLVIDGAPHSVSGPTIRGRDYTAQIGAYQSREATDRALYLAAQKLPAGLRHATPMVAPLKSVENGWLFRARLGNLSKLEAERVCKILASCLVLAPEGF